MFDNASFISVCRRFSFFFFQTIVSYRVLLLFGDGFVRFIVILCPWPSNALQNYFYMNTLFVGNYANDK